VNKEPNRRDRQAASTRSALINAATARFGADGYQRTTLDAVAGDLGVTKGAAYHHFADKKALFAAVFLAVQRHLVVAVARKSTSGAPYDRLRDACAAYLDECTPSVARIVLVDGPAVLGEIDWHETEDRLWLRALRDLIDAAQLDGRFASVDTDLAARVFSASLTQLATAAIDDPSSPLARDVQLVLAAMLRGFEVPK
jgi:AcrR family transcriptional regulator